MNYDERQKFEHELIHRRLTWLLSSQSLLFAAVALTSGKVTGFNKNFFLIIICGVGIIISLAVFLAVLMTIKAKYQSYLDELGKQKDSVKNQKETKSNEHETNPFQWGVRTKYTRGSLFFDSTMPIVFAIAWIILIFHFICTIDSD